MYSSIFLFIAVVIPVLLFVSISFFSLLISLPLFPFLLCIHLSFPLCIHLSTSVVISLFFSEYISLFPSVSTFLPLYLSHLFFPVYIFPCSFLFSYSYLFLSIFIVLFFSVSIPLYLSVFMSLLITVFITLFLSIFNSRFLYVASPTYVDKILCSLLVFFSFFNFEIISFFTFILFLLGKLAAVLINPFLFKT